jgi:TetR/AcrR family transcriptional regulator, regulator of cefoperazone and chloramphenicol sensitivity
MSQPNAIVEPGHAETRQRLLEAAAAIFAEQGFRRATVREICRRAGTNVAAVNYHFRDKEQLYTEILLRGCRQANERYPLNLDMSATATPEERLALFIQAFILHLLDPEPASVHGRLMAHEMIEPTHALAIVARESIQPIRTMLESIVRELLGPEATMAQVRLGSASILGQCLFYHHARPINAQLYPELRYTPVALAQLAAHITRFSLAGLRRISRGGEPE